VVKFDFFHSKLRKQPFFAENFKIQEGPSPPSGNHGRENNKKLKLETFSFFWCKYLNTDSRNQLFTGEKGLKNYKNQPTFFKNILCKKSLGQLKNN